MLNVHLDFFGSFDLCLSLLHGAFEITVEIGVRNTVCNCSDVCSTLHTQRYASLHTPFGKYKRNFILFLIELAYYVPVLGKGIPISSPHMCVHCHCGPVLPVRVKFISPHNQTSRMIHLLLCNFLLTYV